MPATKTQTKTTEPETTQDETNAAQEALKAAQAAVKEARQNLAKLRAAENGKPKVNKRELADRIIAVLGAMEATPDEKQVIAQWMFFLPVNKDNWPTVLPKPTRGSWRETYAADTAAADTK